ncbi:MAG TPA: dTDP-4-dehydrorhamnose 3,5-epimerase family protein [Polyangia bacterium]|jgi:dTDP-4-dehydrorhamnose 3,5-epimerase|nr:dTDP-4-dehydrorhamnose 3,5-epimerase family protein [Polyangia bacterium]
MSTISAPLPVHESARIRGVHVIPLRAVTDDRGYFFESFRRSWLPPGAPEMVQGNVSFSQPGVLRGMHYHLLQSDFWLVPSGHVRAALFDLRATSPSRGVSQVLDLGEDHPSAVYIPPGVAHGFYALSASLMTYLVDQYFDNNDEKGIRWDDPALGIDWGARDPILSARDQKNPLLADVPAESLPL